MKTKLLLALSAAFILITASVSYGQAPNLGTAADFVLFSTNGAVSNTGISQLTGNVGTNNGSSTAFGNVNGVMHDADLASGQCAADLLIAYNQLNSTVPNFFPASLLGNGQILTAGVYSISSAATINLDLTLNAQGNANAVFIFQIQGSLSANANTKVKLINGALACNVFWKVEGVVSMASGTSMKGTVIANNAAIIMNSGDTLEGRALSTAGSVTINGILAYTPIGCGSPTLLGPSAPALASAACYTIFSSDGAVTNTGISTITGDVGTNVGLTTGFNALNVNGTIHPIADGSTAAAAADLLNAYAYLNLIPYDIELLYPAQFGRNLVLTPHAYILNAATVLTDTLYLNALGDSNAVFMIHINGALSTSTYSKVILMNGAKSKNVYWEVNGAVDINDYSIFRGTIVCNNGAASLKTGMTLDGRLLLTTGTLTTAAITAIMPAGCGMVSPPNIITEPTNKTVCAGSSVHYTVVATGTGLTYHWRKGTTVLVNGGNITGATSATLTINPTTVLDVATNYNVIVSGPSSPNDTSANVSLAINTAPSITLQPVNQEVCAGSPVNFTAAATGAGLTYQWRKGTVNLINGGNILGATTETLSLDPANGSDAAINYNVVITGTCPGTVTSTNAIMVINTIPSITFQPAEQIACVGSVVKFSVTATGTGLTYQWRKGTVNLTNGGTISGATSDTLIISSMAISDTASNYNVVVNGTCVLIVNSENATLSLCIETKIGSLDRANSTKTFSVYPNPFSTRINVMIATNTEVNNAVIKIYNILGEEVMVKKITKQLTTLETNNLPSGIYLYTISDNSRTIQSGKLIAQ
ncbi:MAG: ice-binding family protein [Bacteroidota bacterium]